jgi:hypothetical protein
MLNHRKKLKLILFKSSNFLYQYDVYQPLAHLHARSLLATEVVTIKIRWSGKVSHASWIHVISNFL